LTYEPTAGAREPLLVPTLSGASGAVFDAGCVESENYVRISLFPIDVGPVGAGGYALRLCERDRRPVPAPVSVFESSEKARRKLDRLLDKTLGPSVDRALEHAHGG
jgi:hypothetical protein